MPGWRPRFYQALLQPVGRIRRYVAIRQPLQLLTRYAATAPTSIWSIARRV
ncbi:hypothetical protein KCP78_02285 [Salmonella enterica subsp. enterica]|nr:hypothetical protein KCP78_02285 [Salmonella enterica subsp. enterica]